MTKQLQRISETLINNASLMDDVGLLNGKTGIALFLFHLANRTENNVYAEYAGDLIDQICESLRSEEQRLNSSH